MNHQLFGPIESRIDTLMEPFDHTKKDIGYAVRWTFCNGMRFDLIDYDKEGIVILRVSRGAWLVKQYPILAGWFDEVMKVIAKSVIPSVDRIENKNLLGILTLLDQAPKGVGVLSY